MRPRSKATRSEKVVFNMFLVLQSPLTRDCILNLCDVGKVCSVGDAQAPHSMGMSPLLGKEMGSAQDINICTGCKTHYQSTAPPVLYKNMMVIPHQPSRATLHP